MRLSCFNKAAPLMADEWTEAHVRLNGQKFSYARRPFMRLPTRCMSDINHTCRVVLECSAQLSKSTALLNFLGWIYNQDPANTLFIMDSMNSCNKITRNRLRPFLRDQAGVKSLKRGEPVKDKSASAVNISFGTGHNLMIGSARSPSDLCSFPAKYIIADETARFPVELEQEGDPIYLLLKRQLTFKGMFVMASTPTTPECSIHQNYLIGTREDWSALCACGHYMPVRYADIDWSSPDQPTYACEQCGTVYTEPEIIALPHQFSPPQNPTPFKDKYGRLCRSFHVSAPLAHECYTWAAIRAEELEARAKGLSTYRSFVNTTLGEPYVAGYDEQLNIDALLRCKKYFTKDTLPDWVDSVCIGADTQDNRIEYLVCGTDKRGTRMAFIERGAVLGSLKEPEVWAKWKTFLAQAVYHTKDGQTLYPALVCQDAGGHFYHDVLALGIENARIRPVKGYASSSGHETAIIRSLSDVTVKALGSGIGHTILTMVNTVPAKDIIRANMLKVQSNAANAFWVISSAPDAHFDPLFFDEMNAEIREENTKGVARWVCKPNVRNEMLDCCVYCLAAFELTRMVKGNVADHEWVESAMVVAPDVAAPEHSVAAEPSLSVDELLSEMAQHEPTGNNELQTCTRNKRRL